MPVGVRDILLIIRANDQASRALRSVAGGFHQIGGSMDAARARSQALSQEMIRTGTNMMRVGAGIAVAGIAGIAFFASAAKAAIEYNRTAALTTTQIDLQAEALISGRDTALTFGEALKKVGQIGINVANDIGAPFDQMQGALFDIFSSMDVGIAQAEGILRSFAKAAVAGQVDIQVAGRATIAVMNGFANSANPIKSVTSALDVQFQMVRRGVGTYQEFASVLGRVIPAAVNANQTFETVAGSMAFLTRAGLSTAMAATSVARAFELITQPKVVAAIEAQGVAMRNNRGEFRQINDILRELVNSEGWKGLTGPDLVNKMKETFGTGTIMARRFLNLVIAGFQEGKTSIDTFIESMEKSGGSLEAAFKAMSDQPAVMLQLLKNRFQTLRVEIGNAVIPALMILMNNIGRLVTWFSSLNDKTKESIARGLLFVSVATAVGGVLLILAGAFTILQGALVGMITGLTAAQAKMMIFAGGGVIGAIIAAAVLIAHHWGTIGDVFDNTAMRVAVAAAAAAAAVILLNRALNTTIVTAFVSGLQTLYLKLLYIGDTLSGVGGKLRGFGQSLMAPTTAAGLLNASLIGVTAGLVGYSVVMAMAARETAKGDKEVSNFGKSMQLIAAQRGPAAAIAQYRTQLEMLKGEHDATADAIRALTDEYKAGEKTYLQIRGPMKDLTQDLTDNEKRAQDARDAIGDLRVQMEAAKTSFINMLPDNIGSKVAELTDGLEEIPAELQLAASKAAEFQKSITTTFDNSSDAIDEFGDAATGSLAQVNKALKSTLKSNTEFFNNLKKLSEDTSGAVSAENIAKLAAKGVKEVGPLVQQLADDVQNHGGNMAREFETLMGGISGFAGYAGEQLSGFGESFTTTVARFQLDTGAWVTMMQSANGELALLNQTTGQMLSIDFNPLLLTQDMLAAKLGITADAAGQILTSLQTAGTLSMDGLAVQILSVTDKLGLTKRETEQLQLMLGTMKMMSFQDLAGAVDVVKGHLGLTNAEANTLKTWLQNIKDTNFDPVNLDVVQLGKELNISKEKAALVRDWLIKAGQQVGFDPTKVSLKQIEEFLGKDTEASKKVHEALQNMGQPENALDGVKNLGTAADTAREKVNGIQSALNKLQNKTITITVREVKEKVAHGGGYIMHAGGVVPKLHGGGTLRADEVAAILQRGEYVINRRTVRRLGVGFFQSVNRMHSGGEAGAPTPSLAATGQTTASFGGSQGDRHIHINGRFESPDEIIRELDWQWTTKGWGEE